jgi:succinate dehydrogenase/fumarate reductase cytochrome b subunit
VEKKHTVSFSAENLSLIMAFSSRLLSKSKQLYGGKFIVQRENAVPFHFFSKEAALNRDGNLHPTDQQNLIKTFARSGEIDGTTFLDIGRLRGLGCRSPTQQLNFGGFNGTRNHSTITYANASDDDIKPNNSLRPLSPHLPVYKPQINSTRSILNRIAASYLTGISLAYYLVFVKMSDICMTSETFYKFLFYSDSIIPISLELSAVAAAYHAYYGITHLFEDFKGIKFRKF